MSISATKRPKAEAEAIQAPVRTSRTRSFLTVGIALFVAAAAGLALFVAAVRQPQPTETQTAGTARTEEQATIDLVNRGVIPRQTLNADDSEMKRLQNEGQVPSAPESAEPAQRSETQRTIDLANQGVIPHQAVSPDNPELRRLMSQGLETPNPVDEAMDSDNPELRRLVSQGAATQQDAQGGPVVERLNNEGVGQAMP